MSEIIDLLPVIFIASSLILLVTRRFSIPAYSSYIVTGTLIGFILQATNLGFLPPPDILDSGIVTGIAEIGAAFLIFVTAIRITPQRIKRFGSESFKTSAAQVLIQHIIGFTTGIILGLGAVDSFFIGFAASISSSLVSMNLVNPDADDDKVYTVIAESISLIDDGIAAILTVFVISGLAVGSLEGVILGSLLLLIPYSLRDTVAETVLDRYREDPETLLLIGIASVISLGYMAKTFGVNPIVGVFGAGILLSKTPYNQALIEALEPIKDFFSAVFFVSLGTIAAIPGQTMIYVTAVLLTSIILVRPLSIVFLLRRQGIDSYNAYKAALNLDQISEFTLLAALLAEGTGVLSTQIFQAIVFTAAITFITSDLSAKYADRIYDLMPEFLKFESIDEASYGFNDKKNHSIVVGYDTIGRKAASKLENPVIIAAKPGNVEEAEKDDMDVVFGNPLNDKTWIRAGVEGAEHIISTIPEGKHASKAAEKNKKSVIVTETDEKAESLSQDEKVLYAETIENLSSTQLKDKIQKLHKA